MKILIVDDEPDLLDLFKRMAQRCQHEVTAILSPLEALKRLEQENFDLICSDLMMPEMNGDEFIALIRARGHTIPIMLISAGTARIDTHEVAQRFSIPLLLKPFTFDQFREALSNAFSQNAASSLT